MKHAKLLRADIGSTRPRKHPASIDEAIKYYEVRRMLAVAMWLLAHEIFKFSTS